MICKTCAAAADAVSWARNHGLSKTTMKKRVNLAEKQHGRCEYKDCTCQHRVS